MNILIAEDDPTCSTLLRELLRPYGECQRAQNGLEAVELYKQSLRSGPPFDLICLDIMMPIMNGQDALREIRKLERQHGIGGFDMVKIIMTTVLEDAQNIIQALVRGPCEGYITKPLSRKAINDKMRELGFKELP